MYDIAIIGAGIIGTAIARELSKYKLTIALVEKNSDVANEATAANGGIIYDGYNAKPNKFKGKLTLRGNAMYDEICKDLDVRFKRIGLLLIAFGDDDQDTIQDLYERGVANVPGLRLLGKDEVLAMEPELSDEVVGALYSPSCGIVYPWELSIALAENAMDNGVELLLNREVIGIEKTAGNFKITMTDNMIRARYVINCAGSYADKINEMVASPSFKMTPKRGQYIVLDKDAGSLLTRIVIPCKSKTAKAASLIPTIGGNLLLGPAMETIEYSEDNQVTASGLAFIKASVMKNFSNIPMDQIIQSFAGIKAKAYITDDESDFIIEESQEVKGFINVAGINSPGMTCAPAIAEYVTQIVQDIYRRNETVVVAKEKFKPHRKRVVRFKELDEGQKTALVTDNAQYGRIICRCEMVTEGEIVDAIHRNCGATTLKGVKRRTGSGLGRCQGGFCGPKIVEILAREQGKAMDEILYDHNCSYIVTGQV